MNTQKPIPMLDDQQLAKLFARLEVPVAVQSILDHQTPFTEDTRLALHDLISGQTPDQALLSIAISAMLLDARLRDVGQRCAEILALSAEMMVQDYAPLYLEQIAKHPHGTLFDRSDIDFLSTIPEDLENIGDLLAVVADVLPDNAKGFAALANILSVQAQAQALVAETLVEAFSSGEDDHMDQDDHPDMTIEEGEVFAHAQTAVATSNNVVPFRRA